MNFRWVDSWCYKIDIEDEAEIKVQSRNDEIDFKFDDKDKLFIYHYIGHMFLKMKYFNILYNLYNKITSLKYIDKLTDVHQVNIIII